MEKDEKMRLQAIRQAGIKYKQISLWLTALMALAILFACRVSAYAMIYCHGWLTR